MFIAAGFGSRLVPITFNTPKPLVRVNGTRIIDTLLDAVAAAGIPEILIVRGYLGEQFDQLLYKYPNIKFVENPVYNEANNISSAVCVRYLLKNAYVLEADLVLKNRALIRKYEYESNMLGIPVDRSDDWCLMTDGSGVITQETVGGLNCHQMVGISFWSEADGGKLAGDLDEVYRSPGGKERYWEQVPLVYKKENYSVHVRECSFEDITEIDTFNELKQIDKALRDLKRSFKNQRIPDLNEQKDPALFLCARIRLFMFTYPRRGRKIERKEKCHMKNTQQGSLKRQLNPMHVWAIAFGCIIGWGSFINPGKKFLPNSGVAGTAIAMVLGALVMMIIAYSYAYMVPKYPQAGGEFTFTKMFR